MRPDLLGRVQVRLQVLHAALSLDDLNLPGWNLHKLHAKPARWAVAVNGPWRVTFEWDGKDAHRVDLEQYH